MSTPSEQARLDDDDVMKVARLSMLDLTKEEAASFPSQLNAILERVADMETLDTEGVQPTAHPYELTNVFRDDKAEAFPGGNDRVLATAPDVEDNQFKVPPALGGEEA